MHEESISVAEMEIIVPVVAQRMRMPCERATYLSREHSDMIIICLAVVFLLVVVVLETCGSFPSRYVVHLHFPSLRFLLTLCDRSRRGAGEIRLEDEKRTIGGGNASSLSIQADEL